LIRPVLHKGELVESEPEIAEIRSYAANHIAALPSELFDLRKSVPYRVEVSGRLAELTEKLRQQHQS
jgi:hypothetical protein